MSAIESAPIDLWKGSRKEPSFLTLQHRFVAEGTIASAVESLTVRFTYPAFTYGTASVEFPQVYRGQQPAGDTVEISQNLRQTDYEAVLPGKMLVADMDRDSIFFLTYVLQHYSWQNTIDPLSLTVQTDFFSEDEISLGKGPELKAVFFLKNFYDSNGSPYILSQVNDPAKGKALAAEFIGRNAFLVNAAVYTELKNQLSPGDTPNSLLHIIAFYTDLSSGRPVLNIDLSEADKSTIHQMLNSMKVADTGGALNLITGNFGRLFDFPVSTKAIQFLDAGGTFTLTSTDGSMATKESFAYYTLSLAYDTINTDSKREEVDIVLDWNEVYGDITGNIIQFSFSGQQLIVPAAPHEEMTVSVKAPDGMILWEKEYRAGSSALQHISVSLPMNSTSATTEPDRTKPNPKRLQGQLLDMTGGKVSRKDAIILIQAKAAKAAHWSIVGSALSDKDGYFSLPYPAGVYTAAQAVVSLMPHSPAAIPVGADAGDGRTISDDFLYLLLKDVVQPAKDDTGETKDDCDCHNTLKATRLPDQADLIHSDEYTQDLGAGCINLSTPNRTLREYSYRAVVRTSDPDVANYTLTRTTDKDTKANSYTLTGDNKKIKRKAIDLYNPIRWQDAPDHNDNLNFYQSVTVSAGHILHYKSQFKADGYSLGELLYSLPLAPGQKKQVVIFDSSHSLEGAETQQLSVSERLAANLVNDRDIVDQLGGNISEGMRGNSSATTAGVSASLGAAGSVGAISGSLGVAGGWSNSNSDASQDSSRNIAQFFSEKLRTGLMQNADSYRQQNASVISTTNEAQKYAATTEVVANHNHCHSLTMMYFEVLKHYAIYQELSSVEECVFVPLLMTSFTLENIYKWQDVLAASLLPIPSNTYLPSIEGKHPLAKAFDAVSRIKTAYANVDFPETQYDKDPIRTIWGTMQVRVNLPRPKTHYDRILSLPVVNTTVTEDVDPADIVKGAVVSFFTLGISLLGQKTRAKSETIQVKSEIFDSFMKMDANYASVPPAQSIRIVNFYAVQYTLDGKTISLSGEDFFGNDAVARRMWTAYARILGIPDVLKFLDTYFNNQLIADWDRIFYDEIAPLLYERIIKNFSLSNGINQYEKAATGIGISLTALGRYKGGEQLMTLNVRGSSTLSRDQLPVNTVLNGDGNTYTLKDDITLILENVNLVYSTAHFNGQLFSGYVGDDIPDGAKLYMPENNEDKRDPRKEDIYIKDKLIDHLNSNLEYYNKVLWYNLDPDRRYMLLDGFNIQVFNDFSMPIGLKSVASVIKNELVAVVGNSLVFPVASGFRVSRAYITEKRDTGSYAKVDLFEHYKPLTPMQPYRLSVPSKGVFVEAVKGQCDSCEKVEVNTSQDWDKFKADEPTKINSITPPTPATTDWKATFKDLATPVVSMQQAPTLPTPGAGLSGLSEALTKSDSFRDITGLAKNQENAMKTYETNMNAAVKMAEMASKMASQEHNTDKSAQIMQNLKDAKESGAISQDDYNKLLKKHLEQQIDGGDSKKDAAKKDADEKKAAASKKLTDAVVKSAAAGGAIEVTEKDEDGVTTTVKIDGHGKPTKADTILTLAKMPGTLEEQGSDETKTVGEKKKNDNWAVAATLMLNAINQTESKSVADNIKALGDKYVKIYEADNGYSGKLKAQLVKDMKLVEKEAGEFTLSDYVEAVSTYGALWITIWDNEMEFAPNSWIIVKITGTNAEDDDNGHLYYVAAADGKADDDSLEDFTKIVKDTADKKSSNYSVLAIHSATKVPKKETKK